MRLLGILLIGLFCGFAGFVGGSMFFAILLPGVAINGREGYEAGGPIGLLIGVLIGLAGGSVLVFRRRAEK